MGKKSNNEVNLLKRALKIAAIEAYQTEIIEAHMEDDDFNESDFPKTMWIKDCIEKWLQEAELIPE